MTNLHPLDASWLESARLCEASFSEDVLPADRVAIAPREAYRNAMRAGSVQRALPRMQEQGPWIGDHAVPVPVARNTSPTIVDMPIITTDAPGVRHD